MNIRARVIVSGVVQGVNFRYHTQSAARRIGVAGWVRNLADGTVEGCFEGEEGLVEELIAWCRRGPVSARVDDLHVERQPYLGEFSEFMIIR